MKFGIYALPYASQPPFGLAGGPTHARELPRPKLPGERADQTREMDLYLPDNSLMLSLQFDLTILLSNHHSSQPNYHRPSTMRTSIFTFLVLLVTFTAPHFYSGVNFKSCLGAMQVLLQKWANISLDMSYVFLPSDAAIYASSSSQRRTA